MSDDEGPGNPPESYELVVAAIQALDADRASLQPDYGIASLNELGSWLVDLQAENSSQDELLREAQVKLARIEGEVREIGERLDQLEIELAAEAGGGFTRFVQLTPFSSRHSPAAVESCEIEGEGDSEGGAGEGGANPAQLEPDSGEPFICQECGRQGTQAGNSQVCSECELDYQRGRADPEWAFSSDPEDLSNLSIYGDRGLDSGLGRGH